jgi:hypothetical protein
MPSYDIRRLFFGQKVYLCLDVVLVLIYKLLTK